MDRLRKPAISQVFCQGHIRQNGEHSAEHGMGIARKLLDFLRFYFRIQNTLQILHGLIKLMHHLLHLS